MIYLIAEKDELRDEELGEKTLGKIVDDMGILFGFFVSINEPSIVEEGGKWELIKIFNYETELHSEFGREITFLSGVLRQNDLELKARINTIMFPAELLEKKK